MVEMLDNVLRQIRGVFADPGEQGRSARPLPASAYEVQVLDGRNAALVNETPTLVLDLGDRYPVAFVFVTGCPEHSVDLGGFPIGEGDFLPFRLNHTTYHGHTSSLQPFKL